MINQRHSLAELLRCHFTACPPNNFLLRPHLEQVNTFAAKEAWVQLSAHDHALLASTLAPLPSTQEERDGDTAPMTRRFDLLLYNLQLAQLRVEPRFARLQKQLQELAVLLEAKHAVPMVAAELDLIRDLLRDEWFQDVSLLMLEEVRRRLHVLVGLIETTAQKPLYTNFTDELGKLHELDAAALLTGDTFKQFRLWAREFLRAHKDHLTMQRLRRSRPLTSSDLTELQNFLMGHGIGDEQVIARATEESNGFGLFICSMVGLERTAAKDLFAEYLAEGTHTVNQIRFINEVIDELTKSGAMHPDRLYDAPFSDLAPTGPESLSSAAESEKLFDLLSLIRQRAEPFLTA